MWNEIILVSQNPLTPVSPVTEEKDTYFFASTFCFFAFLSSK